jgi:hypothetical protein
MITVCLVACSETDGSSGEELDFTETYTSFTPGRYSLDTQLVSSDCEPSFEEAVNLLPEYPWDFAYLVRTRNNFRLTPREISVFLPKSAFGVCAIYQGSQYEVVDTEYVHTYYVGKEAL